MDPCAAYACSQTSCTRPHGMNGQLVTWTAHRPRSPADTRWCLRERAAGHVSPEGGFTGQPYDEPDHGTAADRRRGPSVEVVISVSSETQG